jgi:hypothetical protein
VVRLVATGLLLCKPLGVLPASTDSAKSRPMYLRPSRIPGNSIYRYVSAAALTKRMLQATPSSQNAAMPDSEIARSGSFQ